MKNAQELYYDYLASFLNVPYLWGGDDAIDGIDCSGLVIESHKMLGLVDKNFDTTARGLYVKYDFKVHPHMDSLEFGDLVFYGKTTEFISHVAIYIGSGYIIEAGGGTSKTVDKESAARDNASVRIRRYDQRSDLIAANRPPLPWNGFPIADKTPWRKPL